MRAEMVNVQFLCNPLPVLNLSITDHQTVASTNHSQVSPFLTRSAPKLCPNPWLNEPDLLHVSLRCCSPLRTFQITFFIFKADDEKTDISYWASWGHFETFWLKKKKKKLKTSDPLSCTMDMCVVKMARFYLVGFWLMCGFVSGKRSNLTKSKAVFTFWNVLFLPSLIAIFSYWFDPNFFISLQ